MQLGGPFASPALQPQPVLPDVTFVQSAARQSGPIESFTANLTAAVIRGAGKHTESLNIKSVTSECPSPIQIHSG